jgi:putative transposase
MNSPNIEGDVKRLSLEIADRHKVIIRYMETDKDHIHYMIETTPNINLANFVKTMKSYITYHIWHKYTNYLSKCFWNEHTFFSDGYFLASIGNVSQEILKEYIENQGK